MNRLRCYFVIRGILFLILSLLILPLTGCEREKAGVEEKIKGVSPTEERDVNFEDKIKFMGYDVRYGIIPEIVYYWRVTDDIKNDWTAFVHFIGPDGRIAFQNDHLLLSEGKSSSKWSKGSIHKEIIKVDLPKDIPYGTYLIKIGLWDSKTGIRLKIKKGFLKSIDEVVLGEFKVIPGIGEKLPDPLTGRIVFTSMRSGNFDIHIIGKDGIKKLINNQARDEQPVWSPDGSKIAFVSNRDGNKEIYIMDADGKNERRLTSNYWDDGNPSWSPDGRSIVFGSKMGMSTNLYIMDIEKGNSSRITNYVLKQAATIPSWSPDGKEIVFTSNRWFGYEISKIDINVGVEKRLTNRGGNCWAAWSPNGKEIAFVSNRNGKARIWLMSPDGQNQRLLSDGPRQYDYHPSWSPDGRSIAYLSTDNPYDEKKGDIFVIDISSRKTIQITYETGSNPSWHN